MIYMYIYRGRHNVLQQDIVNDLRMSRPTVTNHLAAMEEEGLIFRSTGDTAESGESGRRPLKWSISDKYKIALGVEILKHGVKIAAVNLYGEVMKYSRFLMEYENTEDYYGSISLRVKEFIKSLGLEARILGIGFALQGLVSEDGKEIIYGEILKCTGLKIDVFTRRLDYPCRFVHEPDGAALSELWVSPELQDAIYLSMSEHLGGALILGRRILNGQHRHSATFEHITACKKGELCYCGKRGCYETVCSKVALLSGEEPDEFFARVREGEPEASGRWQNFLKYLGKLIAHLHLLEHARLVLYHSTAAVLDADVGVEALFESYHFGSPLYVEDY